MATTLPSAQDQYMLELINRGRANPQAEADRYGIELNEGVRTKDTISTDARQPLAFNLNLNAAAEGHSQWLLDNNKFQHKGEGGTNSRKRMQNAGYTFTGSSGNGENLAWLGTTGWPNFTIYVGRNYENLFVDEDYRNRAHRVSLMNPKFEEIGISSLQGQFTSRGRTFNAVMTTQDFAYSAAGGPFITGVAYTDAVNNDDFYTVGEGIGGITVTAVDTANSANTFTTTTWGSGGYSLDVDPNATYDVTFSGDLDEDSQADDTATYEVTVGSENVKQDVVSDNLVKIDNDTIAENSNNNTVVGNLTISDSDPDETNTYELLNDANGRFALDGDQIVVADGSQLDFESNQTHNITVRTTDGGGESFNQQLTINVTDVDETPPNSAPTAVQIDSNTIAENSDNNTVVGNLTTSDPDAGDTHTYELLNDANGRFALDGDQIVIADGSGLDFESNETHNITVRTTDGESESFNQQLTINVTDVDETPPELENVNTMYGSDKNDRMLGTVDNDVIHGEGGNDVLLGRSGDDLLNGGLGNDRINGENGNDNINGGLGNDNINGGNDDDLLNGDSGNDNINGGSGNDNISGGSGNDNINGGSSNDNINGGSGNDNINGGSGMDTLTGVDITSAQPGYNEIDILRGNAHADLFILGDNSQAYYTGNGINDYAQIDTFSSAKGDKIQLSGSSNNYTLRENVTGLPKGTAIYSNDDLVGIVKNVRNMDLNSSDFSFV